MTFVKVLTAALLFWSLPSIGQVTTQPNSTQPSAVGAQTAQPVEPWQTVSPKTTIQDPLTRILSGESNVYLANQDEGKKNLFVIPAPDSDKIVLWPEGEFGGDSVCFTIRSYVVARDDKNSDSVHPVGCQPATRYRLKKAVTQSEPLDK